MNYRKAILRELYRFYREKGPGNYLDISEKYPAKPGSGAALKQLMREELVRGMRSGRTAITGEETVVFSINPERIEDVRKELLVWYRDPRFIIPALLALGGLLWAIFSKFL